MRFLFFALAACSAADAAKPNPELFEDDAEFRLPCWTTRPHLPTKRVSDLRCRVDRVTHTNDVRAARVVCDDVRGTAPSIAEPMLEGWFVVERGLGAWHLGYGRDRDRPLLPEFGWQRETPLDAETLGWLRKDGPDYPERPAPRSWSAWASDDYEKAQRTRENNSTWCTQTKFEGNGGLPKRRELCWANGTITGASIAIFQGWLADPRCERRPTTDPLCDQTDTRAIDDEPVRGWTMQTRCGDAPFLYVE